MSLNSDGTTNAHESGFTLDLIAAKGFGRYTICECP